MLSPEMSKAKVEEMMSDVQWTVAPTDPISEALSMLKKHSVMEIPVVEGDRLKGFIKLRTLAKRRKIPLNAQTKSFMVAPPRVRPSDRISDTVEKLITRDYTSLPVTTNSVLKGIISRRDIIRGIVNDMSLRSMTVESIMNFAPFILDQKETVFKAISMLELAGEPAAAIIDDRNRFQGMVTSTSLATWMEQPASRRKHGLDRLNAHRNRDVGAVAFLASTMGRRDSIDKAAHTLLDNELPVVFVLDGTEVVGSISEIDILEVLMRGASRTGPLIQIAGIEEIRLMDARDLNDIIERYISRIEKISEVNAVTVRIKHHHQQRDEDKYTVNVKVTMKNEVISREGYDYDIGMAIDDALTAVEKQVRKDHDKRVR
jgi:CBS domain-containing protein